MFTNKKIFWFFQTGCDFFDFLNETNQASVTNKDELKEIYNHEYKRDEETKYPPFGSVLYGLKRFNKITRQGDSIRFCFEGQRHSSKRRQSEPSQSGAASHGTVPTSSGEEGMANKMKTDWAPFILEECIRIKSNPPLENGKLNLRVDKNELSVVNMTIENIGTEPVYFTNYTLQRTSKLLSLTADHKVTRKKPVCLQPGASHDIPVKLRCSLVGCYTATLAFEFKSDRQASTKYCTTCSIEIECITALGLELAPIAPYKPKALPAQTPEVKPRIVDGLPPERLSKRELKNEIPLKDYSMPPDINQKIKLLMEPSSSVERELLRMDWENYSRRFSLLLHLEEYQMEMNLQKYNISDTTMSRDQDDRNLLVLEVPGLAENRPSVLRGDSLLVHRVGNKQVKYRGYVHSVQQCGVKLGFSPKFLDRFKDGMKFNVEFVLFRLTLRLQHRAVELAVEYGLEKVLFPSASALPSKQSNLPKLRLFDIKLEKNREQYQAVQHIVAGSSTPAPYVVYGPPGTGKTVTLVEAIKQIEKDQPSCHILACAPCNSAVDLLCEKIVENVEKHKVFRMYASSCNPNSVPEIIKRKASCNLKGGCFFFPAKEELMEYRIIVTTLFTAGRLITGNIYHFTHVFVDEAGQALEPECVIPLAGLLSAENGQVVLAGDPRQLGPIVTSSFAMKYSLGVSLLERIMNHHLYQRKDGTFNNCFVTKLLHNYRSHPAIMEIPNELFYDGELQFSADESSRNSYCRWEYLPKKDFPVIFHAVYGKEEREASSPSFFNIAEVEVLMDFVKKLLQTQGKNGLPTISSSDIGIITPYRKQAQKIRKALDNIERNLNLKTNLSSLKVAVVEEFQGQERSVIMVSTGRSSPSNAEMDKQFNLGFVNNEKRFNVAVTRAKALLIVVGNPIVLREDPAWARFIQYCQDKGGYLPKEDDMNIQMASLSLDNEAEEATGP